MSFVLNPTTLKMPWMPGMSIQNLWTGIDGDQNRFAYHATSQSFKTYVMTENFIGYQTVMRKSIAPNHGTGL